MAVRHGYGKVAGTDALVFAYDTGDTRNSYKGEPTVNVVPNQTLVWGLYSASMTQNAITAPDGTLTGIKMTATATTQVRTEFSLANPTSLTYYAISIYAKRGSTPYAGFLTYFPPQNSPSAVFNLDTGTLVNSNGTTSTYIEYVKDGWYRIGMVIPVHPDQSHRLVKVLQTSSTVSTGGVSGDYVYYWKPQVENKNHITPHTVGTRSATQGLLDLTGNSSIDLANAGFDSDADIDLDGTDDFIETVDSSLLDLTTNMSFEFVVNADSSQSNLFPRLIDKSVYLIHITQTSPFTIAQNITTSEGLRQTAIGSAFTAGNYAHIITTYDGRYGQIFVDGELKYTKDFSTELACNTDSTSVKFGGNGTTTRSLNGKLPVSKIYNRALTAGEVKNNYSHYKNRFGI